LAATAESRAQVGWATDTWATQPEPKNDFSRANVRSMNWSTITRSPGRISSRKLPQADTATMSVTPSRLSASMLAR
jgi:hypothetical protein